MLNGPFSDWPCYTAEEARAVSDVLLSNKVNYWTGKETRLFETEFASFCGTSHAIAVANGTLALDLALMGLAIGAHYGGAATDNVIVTPRTFIASASCVMNAGAQPVFADVDAHSGNLTADSIAAVLTPQTKAIILVHLAGWPCDMDPIMALAAERGIKVIEDCAQAHGGRYKGRPLGGIGDVGAWSFCQDKIMTTGGEGGMVTTNDPKLWQRMWSLKDHGKSWEAVYERTHPPGFRWLHEGIGTNFRMTEIQAVLGRIQLGRMADWTAARARNAASIAAGLAPFCGVDGPLRMPKVGCLGCIGCDVAVGCHHANYKTYAYVRPEHLAKGWSRDRIVAEVTAHGVPCFQGSCSEVYLEKAFDATGLRPKERCPVAKDLGETSLMFLVHPTLTREEIAKTTDVVADVMLQASTR